MEETRSERLTNIVVRSWLQTGSGFLPYFLHVYSTSKSQAPLAPVWYRQVRVGAWHLVLGHGATKHHGLPLHMCLYVTAYVGMWLPGGDAAGAILPHGGDAAGAILPHECTYIYI